MAGGSGCGRRRKPQSGPAAGGCAFGRLRSSASQAKRLTHGGLAAASMPRTLRNRTHPAFDRCPRSAGMALEVRSVFRRKTDLTELIQYLKEIHPRMAWIYRPSSGHCRGWGGVAVQDRWRHGWRHRAPGMGLRRVLHSHTTRQAFSNPGPLSLLLRLLHLPLQVQGAALPNTLYLTCTSITPSPTRACRASPGCTWSMRRTSAPSSLRVRML